MYQSFVFGVKFIVQNSSDIQLHAREIIKQFTETPRYIHMREREHRHHQLILRPRDTGFMLAPYAGHQLLARNAADYQPWFDDAMTAIINEYERRGHGS